MQIREETEDAEYAISRGTCLDFVNNDRLTLGRRFGALFDFWYGVADDIINIFDPEFAESIAQIITGR